MNLYVLCLLCCDNSFNSGPTALEMMWFTIAIIPLIGGLLYWRNKIVAKIKTEKTFYKNDQLFPAHVDGIEDDSTVEIKEHSIIKRALAIGLIILIIAAPCINLTQLNIFGG